MRATAAAVLAAVALCACGGSSGTSSGAGEKTGTVTRTPTAGSAGAQVFDAAGCGVCHTFTPAGSTGTVGPNLDALKPSYTTVVHQVIHGGGVMPSFASRLTSAQIAAVARFVAGR